MDWNYFYRPEFIRMYMMLALENRNNQDARTMGKLFFLSFDELHDIQFSEALKLILDILQEILEELLFLTEEQIGSFINPFITKLPKYISERLQYKKSA